MIGRELYLPRSWAADDRRCALAGVPDNIDFETRPALATGTICRALNAGVAARWVAGDRRADPGAAMGDSSPGSPSPGPRRVSPEPNEELVGLLRDHAARLAPLPAQSEECRDDGGQLVRHGQ
jgi:DDE superfamily endonuclease